jgi:hypothetical protein
LDFRDPKETSRRRSTPCTRADTPVTHARMRRRRLVHQSSHRSIALMFSIDRTTRTSVCVGELDAFLD